MRQLILLKLLLQTQLHRIQLLLIQLLLILQLLLLTLLLQSNSSLREEIGRSFLTSFFFDYPQPL